MASSIQVAQREPPTDTARQMSDQHRANRAQQILDFGLIRQIRGCSTFVGPDGLGDLLFKALDRLENDWPLPPVVQQARPAISRLRCGPGISARGWENLESARHAGVRNE